MKIRNLITGKQSKFVLLGIATSFFSSVTLAQSVNQQINIQGVNNNIRSIFDQIEKQSNLSVDYDANAFNDKKVLSSNIKRGSVSDVLSQVLSGTNFSYKIEGNHVILLPKASNTSQTKTKKIQGVVLDDKGEAIIGANIKVADTSIGTISDFDGNFTLDVPLA